MFKEFKEFALKGNVVDTAVGIIIGVAFGKIITSFVNDIIMPPFSLLLGKINFSNLYINLTKTPYSTLADAKAAGAATLNYGMFLSNILDFLIVAFVIFIVIRQLNKLKKKAASTPVVATTKECPFCKSQIAIAAIKCPNCTSDLK